MVSVGPCAAASESKSRLEDPTRPATFQAVPEVAVAAPGKKNWKLTLIKLGPIGHSAVLNGQVVHVGDRIDEARVAAIEAAGVVIDDDGQEVVLRLGGEVHEQRGQQ